jgi:two-component system sensor histidine kinase/response regulator
MDNLFTSYSISLGKSHILAVEDSLVQAKKLQHFFDQNNINSKLFSSAIDAYKSAVENPPILIISDIVMPEMDGYEFCTKIKNNVQLRDIPVILLTSLADPLDIVKGLQAGADNFITKPYDEQYLLSRIHFLLANRDMRRSGAGDMSIEIVFQGTQYQINSDKKQILNLLLSVYEAAIHRNSELIEAKQQLENLNINLQTANEELDAFARTVSHDLRSPLGGIIGFTEILKTEFSKNLDNEALQHLEWIFKSAYKMNSLITDLLNYSRSGRANIESVSIDLTQMANETIDDLKIKTNLKNSKIEVQKGLRIKADKALMHIVMDNLIGNAFKYSSKIESPEIFIGSKDIYGQTVYFIKDNGAGFDMADSDKLFNPFVRLHTDREFQGTGVGLSTVKRIIERHGGDVWAESEPGKGATFYFTIQS